ncbi:pentatricopeptide repeat-containing protein mitochondrial-like [Dorcoceras hygrometricum]|uniref:Pentatricopeptide repeat-containing protein mitochondrial-like n=1 Tax=Dorcoceras hygrometricum TaxID=472368 RepID=A0A2Z7BQ32_9LAMI|nr:pentatricopeptide repeat-containing protein mitochondrial-like [Dorcoceras hygrometricum]
MSLSGSTHDVAILISKDVCMAIESLTTLDLPMVVDSIGIYEFKGPYYTLTMTDWFLQALSVIPRGSWGDVARCFTMIRWSMVLIWVVPTADCKKLKESRLEVYASQTTSYPPPPPPLSSSKQVLAGLAQILRQNAGTSQVARTEIPYEKFRKMGPPKFTDYATALKRAFRSEQTLKDLHAEAQRKRPFQAQHHQQQQPKRSFTGPPRPPGQGQ